MSTATAEPQAAAGVPQAPRPAFDYRRIVANGLWTENMVFTQMLALCPLLAVTSSATNGLGMGIATTLVLVMSNIVVALLRNWISPSVRIPVFVVILAGLVTLLDMSLNAWLHDLYKVLGLFIALIAVNCGVYGRAEAFASKHPLLPSIVDGIAVGLGFTLALVVLGTVREILGTGTLFSGASMLLGEPFRFMEMTLFDDYQGFLLMILPPGGFLALGFLIAAKRVWETRRGQRRTAALPDGAGA
ncbi:electron transport complex subunit E [Pseudothauera nasutitermitis]|uniref:Ion-translocating oxidoreductase complex subunit E n=1 Tax=Pseudothauera nasutitermitis TaxID=2565930 RepID=A0A4S4AX08_9RHOO|nr:electron transport complex subunit E [Pseudothauera nasutitermitis]THF64602.1 electron transport complex subunit E [Pseudothauera nasutitermitis]